MSTNLSVWSLRVLNAYLFNKKHITFVIYDPSKRLTSSTVRSQAVSIYKTQGLENWTFLDTVPLVKFFFFTTFLLCNTKKTAQSATLTFVTNVFQRAEKFKIMQITHGDQTGLR